MRVLVCRIVLRLSDLHEGAGVSDGAALIRPTLRVLVCRMTLRLSDLHEVAGVLDGAALIRPT